MKFTNLSNNFSVMGNFMVFDDDVMPVIQKVYSDADIQINHEDVKVNPSGKVMIIKDNKNHVIITLRPSRIDVQGPGMDNDKEGKGLKVIADVFGCLATILEGNFASRIAVVSNYFVFDDNKDVLNKMIKMMPFIDHINKATEFSFRTNAPCVINREECNIVTTINTAMVSSSKDNPRNSIIVVFDCNTLLDNKEERFELSKVMERFMMMKDAITDKLDIFSEGI